MKVSVAMITFNHERFVAQAIEGALMQETKFDYEIIIGEDCSTDATRDILLDYRNRYPNRIKLVLQKTNVGPKDNFADVMRQTNGQYVAFLDGDDYWISPHKLQLQSDVMDSHPEWSMCFHATNILGEDGSESLHLITKKESYVLEDLIAANPIAACAPIG